MEFAWHLLLMIDVLLHSTFIFIVTQTQKAKLQKGKDKDFGFHFDFDFDYAFFYLSPFECERYLIHLRNLLYMFIEL